MQDQVDEHTTWRGDPGKAGSAVPGTALIGKAFRLLDAIGSAPGHVTVAELVETTGWARPTLYRILSALTAHGYARFDPVAQGYTLGYRFLELAQNVWAASDLAAVASIELQRLRDMTGETAYLSVPHDGAMLGLGKFESAHVVRSAAELGVHKPMHCTSQGKAVLAFLPEAVREALLTRSRLERFTPNTITDPALLRVQLGIVRQRGYAIEDEEILLGNRCVGAPVLDGEGRPVAAVSVAGPIWRLTQERAEQLGPEIANVARAIGAQLRGPTERRTGAALGVTAHPAVRETAFHGADPAWDAGQNVLRWVDRLGPAVHTTSETGSAVARPRIEAPIEAAAFSGADAVLVLGGRVQRLRGDAQVSDEPLPDGIRIAALATAPDGEVWAALEDDTGTRIRPLAGSRDSAWSVGARIDTMTWAPDGSTLYAADAVRGVIYALQDRPRATRVLSRLPRVSGEPRGLAVDTSGRLWVALYDGWSVVRLTAEGEVDRAIALPVPRPTGLAFGGADRAILFVTTARIGLTRDVLDNAPLSGRLLSVRPTPPATVMASRQAKRVRAARNRA